MPGCYDKPCMQPINGTFKHMIGPIAYGIDPWNFACRGSYLPKMVVANISSYQCLFVIRHYYSSYMSNSAEIDFINRALAKSLSDIFDSFSKNKSNRPFLKIVSILPPLMHLAECQTLGGIVIVSPG